MHLDAVNANVTPPCMLPSPPYPFALLACETNTSKQKCDIMYDSLASPSGVFVHSSSAPPLERVVMPCHDIVITHNSCQ